MPSSRAKTASPGRPGLGGAGAKMILGGGPLAAAGFGMLFAEYMDRIAGQPSVIRLSTQIDGREVPVEYGISASEYRHFLDAEGREAQSFNGGVFSMDDKYYLGGSFGYDQLNAMTSGGEGGLAGAILGLPGGFIQRRGDGTMMDSLEIGADLYEEILGLTGGAANFQTGLGSPLFDIVAPRMGLVEQVRYTTDANVGMMVGDTDGTMLFMGPDLGVRSAHDHVGAYFSNPLMAGFHHFRDADQAQLFGSFGLMSTMMVAGDAELARAFGGFDAQRILDHVAIHGEAMMGGPVFDVYGYLAGNPDVQQAVGPNLMQAMEHYLNFGVHEGRGFATDEDARARAMARVTGLGLFDETAYLALYPDVAAAVARGEITAQAHYETFGFEENRKPFFDEAGYLARYPDVAEAVANGTMPSALHHFMHCGQFEGREIDPQIAAPQATEQTALPFYDEATYLATNPDVARAVAEGHFASGAEHFALFGAEEGRAPGIAPGIAHDIAPAPAPESAPQPAFSTEEYLAHRPDVLEQAHIEGKDPHAYAIAHHTAFGEQEGWPA